MELAQIAIQLKTDELKKGINLLKELEAKGVKAEKALSNLGKASSSPYTKKATSEQSKLNKEYKQTADQTKKAATSTKTYSRSVDASTKSVKSYNREAGKMRTGFLDHRQNALAATVANDNMRLAISGLARVMGNFSTYTLPALGALMVHQFIKGADAITKVENQLKLVTTSTQEFVFAMEKLQKISINTYSDLNANTKLYTALSGTFASMGRSQTEAFTMIQRFQKALASTNPTIKEAESATLQFTQAMGSGVLRGEEFNSIMENGRGVALVLANALGVNVGQLRSMAHEGELTSDVVMKAFEDMGDSIDNNFSKRVVSVEQSFQNLGTASIIVLDKLNKGIGSGISKLAVWSDEVGKSKSATEQFATVVNDFAKGLKEVDDNLVSLLGSLALMGVAFKAAKSITALRKAGKDLNSEFSKTATVLTQSQQKMVAFSNATDILSAALLAASIAGDKLKKALSFLLRNPYALAITGIVTAISAITYAGSQAGDSIEKLAEAFDKLEGKNFTAIMNQYNPEGLKVMQDLIDKRAKLAELEAKSIQGGRGGKERREKQIELLKGEIAALEVRFEMQKRYAQAEDARVTNQLKNDVAIKKFRDAQVIAGDLLSEQAKEREKLGKSAIELALIEYQQTKEFQELKKRDAFLAEQLLESQRELLEHQQHLKDVAEEQSEEAKKKAVNDAKAEKLRQANAKKLLSLQEEYNKLVMSESEYRDHILSKLTKEQQEVQKLIWMKQDADKRAEENLNREMERMQRLHDKRNDDIKESEKALEKAQKDFEKMIERIDDVFVDVWKDVINGTDNAFESIQKMFNQMLAEMAHQAITKPIMLSIMSSAGFSPSSMVGGSTGGTGGLPSFGSNPLSSITDLGSSALNALGIGTSLSAANASIMSAYGAGMAGLGSATTQGAMLAAQTGAFGSAGASLTGSALGTATATNSVMGSISSGLGAAMPWIGGALAIDALTGGKLSKFVSTGLFGGDWRLKTDDLRFDYDRESGLDASRYTYQKKSGGLLSSTKKKRRYSDMPEIESAYSDMIGAMLQNLDDNANRLGFDLADDFSTYFARSIKKKSSEEIQQIINDSIERIFTNAVGSIEGLSDFVDPFIQGEENTAQALTRLLNQFDLVSNSVDFTNQSIGELNKQSIEATDNITLLAGGLESLDAITLSYYDKFFTESEKFTRSTGLLRDQLYAVNIALPATRNGFRDVVETLDLTSRSGQAAYVALLALSDAADNFYSVIENDLRESFERFESQTNSLSESFLELAGAEELLAYKRELELAIIDDSLKPYQQKLWAMQDEIQALEDSESAYTSFSSTLRDTLVYLGNTFDDIQRYVTELVSGSQATKVLFEQDLALAKSGDRTALSGITGSARSYLSDAFSKSASRVDFERQKMSVASQLSGLSSALSPEQFLANEIKESILGQTDAIVKSLADNFDVLVPIVGESITQDEFKSVYAGTASDEKLNEVYNAIDSNGDGTISALEANQAAVLDVYDTTNPLKDEAIKQFESLSELYASSKEQVSGIIDLNQSITGLTTVLASIHSIELQRIEEQKRLDQLSALMDELNAIDANIASWENYDLTPNDIEADINSAVSRHVSHFKQTSADNLARAAGNAAKVGDVDEVNRLWRTTSVNDVSWMKAYVTYATRMSNAIEANQSIVSSEMDKLLAERLGVESEIESLDGSHADGLGYVPFDGYRAELHKGEAVLTSEENRVYQNQNSMIDRLVNEVRELKRATMSYGQQMVSHAKDTADTLDRWDVIGQPEVRT
jgi:tape measure domain-containing protein